MGKNNTVRFKVIFFINSKMYDGTLTIIEPDKIGGGKKAILTAKEPENIQGKILLVNDTKGITRNWEIFVTSRNNGSEYEVTVLTCSKSTKKIN